MAVSTETFKVVIGPKLTRIRLSNCQMRWIHRAPRPQELIVVTKYVRRNLSTFNVYISNHLYRSYQCFSKDLMYYVGCLGRSVTCIWLYLSSIML